MKWFILLLTGLLVFCSGCPAPVPDRDLKEHVSEEEVVGVWALSQESLALLKRDGFYWDAPHRASHRYQITFLSNGVCVFRSVQTRFGGRGADYHEAKGTWILEHNASDSPDLRPMNRLEMDIPVLPLGSPRTLRFDKQRNSLVLWQYYGDPDLREYMEYRKMGIAPVDDLPEPGPEK